MSQENGEPATFVKYLAVPIYVFFIVSHALTPSFFNVGTMILLVGMLYFIIVLIWLINADKPLDKTKREITSAAATDGTKTKTHVIQKDGYYFALLVFVLQCAAIGLAILLVIFAAAGPVVQSVVLQFIKLEDKRDPRE